MIAPKRANVVWEARPRRTTTTAVSCDKILSRDPAFEDIAYETELENTEIVHGNLAAGQYFWKVSGMKERAVGAPSRVGRLRLRMDQKPPRLDLTMPSTRRRPSRRPRLS